MYRTIIVDSQADYPWEMSLHDEKVKLSSGKIVKGINGIDSFSFTISPLHPLFNDILDYRTHIRIVNTNRNRQEFIGRVLYTNDDMSESGEIKKDVVCESYLGFLCDSVQDAKSKDTDWTIKSFLQYVLGYHNNQVEYEKNITLGNVSAELENIQFKGEIRRENTWDTIKKTLIDVYGGEIAIRCSGFGSRIYLDYLVDEKNVSSTKIALSRNMKSVSRERDPSDIVTRLIPIGKDGLDITSENGGKNYIEDTEAKNLFGIRYKCVEFSEVTSPEKLMESGDEWLHNNNKVRVKYTVTALDLSLLGLDIDDFEVKNYHPLINPLMGIDDTARIIKKTIDICEEVKSSFEIGDNFETVSEIQIRRAREVNQIVNALASDYATIEDVEEAAALVEEEAKRAKGVEASLQTNQDNIAARVETAEGDISSLEVTVGGLKSTVQSQNGNISALTQTVNGFEARVENAEGDISTLTQTVDSISATVSDHTGSISALAIKVNEISASVGDGVTSAELALTIGTDGVARISANADEIALTGNKVSITSNYFTLTKTGGLTCQYATLNEAKVTSVASGSTVTIDQGYISIKNGGAFLNIGAATTSMGQTRGYIRGGTSTGNGIYFFEDGLYLNGNAYANAPIATTSDASKKNSIISISERYSALFDNLMPRLYKYNDGTSNRVHVGFIAQEVEEAINAAGLTSLDFAGFIKSDEQEAYFLRYEEFIALCVHEIQSLKKEIGELKNNG